MASEDDQLKTVRCSHSELKELAKKLEMQEVEPRGTVQKTGGKSTGKNRKDLKDEGRVSRTESNQNKPVSSQNKRELSDRKPSGSKGKVCANSQIVKGKNSALNNERKDKQCIRNNESLSGSQNKNKSRKQKYEVKEDHLDNEYDRGERSYSGSPKLLYDPQTNSSPPRHPVRSDSSKKRINYPCDTGREITRQDLSDDLEKLHVVNKIENDQQKRRENKPHEDKERDLKKIQRKKAEILFAEIGYLEADISNLLSRRLTTEEQLYHILKLSNEVQDKCKSIMLTDLHYFTTKEVYHILWRSDYYQIIERLRGLQKDNQDYDDTGSDFATTIAEILQKYLDSANIFISGLISTLEEEHGFSLKSFFERPMNYDGCNRLVKMALLCCHHCMIFLGDIERYKQQLLSVKEWSLARSYYLKASKIAPRNGKPYNQLAVVAVYAKRRLDAVYYYVRSLTVSNPIMTAREKLHAIFDDVQRKAFELHMRDQEMEGGIRNKIRPTENGRHGPRRGRQRHRSEGRENAVSVDNKKRTNEGRHELWVFYRGGVRCELLFTPDGLIKGRHTQSSKNDEKLPEKPSTKISLNEINKQFEIFFLCSHAMLYSKIGIDHFVDNHRKVLGLFKTLLRHPTCPVVGAKRLVEIMAINMFEVANITHEDSGQLLEGTPVDLAIRLACDIFQCLCEAFLEILLQCSSSNSDNTSGDNFYHVILANFLPAMKVWFDWMQSSIRLLRNSSVSIKKDFWGCVSALLNSLVQTYTANEVCDILPGDLILTLIEDDHLSGFNLLAQASKPHAKVADVSQKDVVCTKLRIEAIQTVAKFLCEFEDLPLRFDESSQQYYVTEIALTSEANRMQENEYVEEINEEDIEDDVIVENVEDFDSDVELANPVKELKAKKDALTKEIMNQKQREEDAKAVLVEHSNKRTLVLEISPQYLVPDTNCFIDHLRDLQYIVESKDFTFVIPLVVINELDGLAKGTSGEHEQGQQRVHSVAERSRAAIDFLEYCFSLGDSQMLALTSKGSVLTTIAFRSEEPTEGRGINDDVILNCCHHYCDAKMDVVNKLASPDQPFTIRRKVVLLTEDRNLRLKAHVQNIPVVTVPQFLEMVTS